MIVGIDLGTTNSAVAALEGAKPKLLPNALGGYLTPSVVGFDSNMTLLVGQPARDLQVISPDRCASVFKRWMGSDWKTTLAGRQMDAVELSSQVLRSLKRDAEAFLGEPVDRAVFTVPAYFNNEPRQATVMAGRLAGLKVERIINEPTAAALAYGVHESGDPQLVAVFDLGGGTFDISIVEFFEGSIEVKSSAGEAMLGGEDFTRAIAREILRDQQLLFESVENRQPRRLARLLQQCELAKRALSRQESAELMFPGEDGGLDPNAPRLLIDREFVRRACAPLMGLLETPVRRALGDAGLTRDRLNKVLLVGGATRSGFVQSLAEEMFRQPPSAELNPDEVVALGAAVQAGLLDSHAELEDLVVVDVAPFTLGVEVAKQLGEEMRTGYFSPIIHRNSVIPVSRAESFSTVNPNQTEIELKIFQGESRRVEDNLQIGNLKVKGIPRGPAGQQVLVRFTYDTNGILEVESTVLATGERFQTVITRYAANLTDLELAEALKRMQDLKTHPRDELVNQALLHRAERLYQELPPPARAQLTLLLDAFEAALQSQEQELVEIHRQQLEQFLSFLDDQSEEL
ncbi:MAG: Hsp70 family protein [Planctomycetota bacterium]